MGQNTGSIDPKQPWKDSATAVTQEKAMGSVDLNLYNQQPNTLLCSSNAHFSYTCLTPLTPRTF